MKRSRAGRREALIAGLIRAAGFSAIFFVALIFLFLLKEGAPAFWEVSLGNLFGERWYPNEDLFGTLPLILGSLLVTAGAVVIALPLGLATAVFIRELAPDWLREILKPLIEIEIVRTVSYKSIDLTEGTFIDHKIDPLAGREAPFFVLGFDARLATTQTRLGFEFTQALDFWIVAHRILRCMDIVFVNRGKHIGIQGRENKKKT